MKTNKPEVDERMRALESLASDAISEAYRLRRLWEFSAAMISANEKKIKPRGRDEERLLGLAKSADHGMAWSGRTDGWLDAGMGRTAAPEDMVTLPITTEVCGQEWSLYTFDYLTQDGKMIEAIDADPQAGTPC